MGLVSSPAVEWFSGFHVGKYAIWSHGSFEEWEESRYLNLKWCIFSDLQKRAGRVFQPSWVGTKPMHREHPTIPVIQHPLQFDVNRYPQNDGLFGGTTVSIDCFSGVSFMASNVAKISGGDTYPLLEFRETSGRHAGGVVIHMRCWTLQWIAWKRWSSAWDVFFSKKKRPTGETGICWRWLFPDCTHGKSPSFTTILKDVSVQLLPSIFSSKSKVTSGLQKKTVILSHIF